MESELAGHVQDDAGAPVVGALVLVVAREFSRVGSSGFYDEHAVGGLSYNSVATATTDNRGNYVVARVPAGTPN